MAAIDGWQPVNRVPRWMATPPGWLGPLLVTALAAALRLPGLDVLPSGIHGDEAFKGLLAEQILSEGYIGPYTRDLAGMPLGTVYVDALSVALFGSSIVAVRIAGALAGVATVTMLYLILRRHVEGRVPFVASLLLSVLCWHLHFSRTGFPIVWWPMVVLLLAHAALVTLRAGSLRWAAVTGALAALGVYVYNGHGLVLSLIGLFVISLWVVRRPFPLRRLALSGGVAACAFVLVLVPMLVYALTPGNEYLRHFKDASTLQSNEWQSRSSASRVAFTVERYVVHWDRLAVHPGSDPVDGTGATILVPPLLLVLAALGAALALRDDRRPIVWLGLLLILFLPLGTVFSEGGTVRRTLPSAPFVAFFAALAIDRFIEIARGASGHRRWGLAVVTAATVAVLLAQNLSLYFRDFSDPAVQRSVMAEAMTDASQYIATLSRDSYVYFYSERWSYDYSIRQFLAPNARGEDRSREFGRYRLTVEPDRRMPVFVMMGPYRAASAEVQRRYPGGNLIVGGPAWDPTFVAYQLPNPTGGHGQCGPSSPNAVSAYARAASITSSTPTHSSGICASAGSPGP
jgi:4-amino-4-deoxy-L-arabinose transferase-like glycosyltransferase